MRCSELKIGEKAIIQEIHLEKQKQAKLFHLGLIEEEEITCKFKNPFHSPIAYQIKGCVFAIRKEDADQIEVAK